MGLDMYLTKKIYVGANYEHRNITGKVELYQEEKEIPINFKKISYIEQEAAYWRKANAVHNWFVENIQEGNDDCDEYPVYIEDIKKLLDTCKKVEENPKLAEELLPSVSGFFFGSTEYDEWYMKDIEYTIKKLEEIIREDNNDEYFYCSSW